MIEFHDKYKAIGKKVHRFRILQRMTQEKLAESALMSVAYVSKIERSDIKTGFSCTTVMKLAKALRVPACILLGEKPCPTYMEYLASIESEEMKEI